MKRSGSPYRFAHPLLAMCALALTVASGPRSVAASTIPCAGDCGADDAVTIEELIKGVNIALGTAPLNACEVFDVDGDKSVTVDEVIKAVNKALNGCFDAVIASPQLAGPTEVVYDSIGIPHIYGPDQNSVAYAQGYVHAAHRFWQMDTLRRSGEGRLSELLGMLTLKTDVTMRTIFTTRDGRRLEDAMWEHLQASDPELAAMVEAYTAGVNAWLADLRAGRNGAALPPEYQFSLINQGPDDLAPWRPQDCVSVGRTLQWNLDNNILYNEMFYVEGNWGDEIWQKLDEAEIKDTVRPAPFAFVPVVPSAQPLLIPPLAAPASVPPALPQPGVAKAVRSLLDEVGRTSPLGPRQPDAGSNNWVVAPGLSDSGLAMLASDPHLGLSNPGVWFLQQLEVANGPAMRVSGSALPGLPGITVGHNDSGAWGTTYAYFDVVDVYVETMTTPPDYPASPRTVLFKGQQVPVMRLQEQFKINGRNPRTYIIEVVPHHGPMLPDPNLTDAVVGLAATGMTMRWTGQEVSDDARASLELMRAQNVSDFRAALRNGVQGANPTNYVWADVHGDIAYSSYARLPQRPAGTVPYEPMPGTGEAEWLTDAEGNIAWLPEDQFPQALNPPDAFIATANSDPTGHTFDNDPLNDGVYFAAWYQNGLREQRIQDMLSNRANLRPAGAKITMADMSAYQYDTASLDAVRLLPFLFTAAEARPELVTAKMSDAIARLRAWAEQKPGSPACNVVSGIDAHELRADVPPRARPVSDEERADAVGSSIYNAWVKQIWEVLPGPDWPHLWEIPWRLVWHLLVDIDQTDPAFQVYTKGANGDSTMWDDPATPEVETRTEVLLAALSRALDLLEQQFRSADMSTWLWGKVHQVQFHHFFAQAAIQTYDIGPIPAPGGFWTVNPATPGWGGDAGNFTFSAGPSQRLVVLLDPAGIKAVNVLPGGENGNPGSAGAYNTINPASHYGDLIPKWINGETVEMRISRQAVTADNQRHVKYVPAEE
jgi:penicillin G amidase